MIHKFQQLRESNPDFDIFSADAIKAFYSLNSDLTMKKLKEQAPQVFNLFMDKYNNSSGAFFFGLAQGVVRFTQSEGGSPGSPEMNFLYELGISDFVQSVADLLLLVLVLLLLLAITITITITIREKFCKLGKKSREK